MNHKKMLEIAAQIAGAKNNRTYLMAALAYRRDGTLICSPNGSPKEPNQQSHAETRLARKLDTANEVFVARILKNTRDWALARPCEGCQIILRSKLVKRVFYTIAPNEWGVIEL